MGKIEVGQQYLEIALKMLPNNEGVVALQIILLMSMNLVKEAYASVVKFMKSHPSDKPLTLFYLLKYDFSLNTFRAKLEEDHHNLKLDLLRKPTPRTYMDIETESLFDDPPVRDSVKLPELREENKLDMSMDSHRSHAS